MRRLLPLALLFLAACPKDQAESCRLNSDCPNRQLCVEGRCTPECREDRDCAKGQVCGDEVCNEPNERLCEKSADCRPGESCRGGVCSTVILVGRDAGSTGSPEADAGASTPEDAGTITVQDGGVPLLPYGAICTRASECASMLCLGPANATSGRCTKTCAADSECFYPDTCVDVPNAGKFCALATTGLSVGAPCPNGPNDCASGLCVTANNTPICTQQCAPLPTCPFGLVCAPVADGTGGSVAVCVPGSGKGFGDGCASGTECASALCVGVATSGAGICTALCDMFGCPLGYTCADVSGVPVCAPEGVTAGAFGAACTSAASCQSGLCLYDPRNNSAFCTIPCASAADCAGLNCVVLASGEAVCAP